MTEKINSEDQTILHEATAILFSKRAGEVSLITIGALSDLCDHYLVGTCSSEAQMKAVINALSRSLKGKLGRPLVVDYKHGDRWAAMDFGDFMVHLFEDEYRESISLDKLWADAKTELLDPKDYHFEVESEDQENEDEYL